MKKVVIDVDSQTYILPFTCETSSCQLSSVFCKERNIVDKSCSENQPIDYQERIKVHKLPDHGGTI